MSILFWAEIMIGSIIPLILFSFKKIRQSPSGLLTGAIILLLGMILDRFDVSWLAVKHPDPTYIHPDLYGEQRSLLPILAGNLHFNWHLLCRHPRFWISHQVLANL